MEILSILLVASGTFMFISGTFGLLRFPDFYCRLHATSTCDTLGALLVLVGLVVYHGFSLISLKILFIMVFFFLANPTATHAIGRAALLNQVKPWTKDASNTSANFSIRIDKK